MNDKRRNPSALPEAIPFLPGCKVTAMRRYLSSTLEVDRAREEAENIVSFGEEWKMIGPNDTRV
jgi:hypothetical protein